METTINSAVIASAILEFLAGFLITLALFRYFQNKSSSSSSSNTDPAEKLKTDGLSKDQYKMYRILIENAITAYTETHGNQVLMFDSINDSFLGQAQDISTLAENVYKHKRIELVIVKHLAEDGQTNYLLFQQGKIIEDETQWAAATPPSTMSS